MIVWLDNQQNRKGSPNENYAREIMELFFSGNRQLHRNRHQRIGTSLYRMANQTKRFFLQRQTARLAGAKDVYGRTGNF